MQQVYGDIVQDGYEQDDAGDSVAVWIVGRMAYRSEQDARRQTGGYRREGVRRSDGAIVYRLDSLHYLAVPAVAAGATVSR